jgi:adenylylsulfate kinase
MIDQDKSSANLFPAVGLLTRQEKETLVGQKGVAIWFTGLSGSGKTTIGAALERELYSRGFQTRLLDGDNVRNGINKNLDFSETDRKENIRRIAEVSKLFIENGLITICCFVSPTEDIRRVAKDIIGEKDFIEVYINTPLKTCEERDVKGLYSKARRGEILNFTGISSAFEAPSDSAIEINTGNLAVEECVKKIINFLQLQHLVH